MKYLLLITIILSICTEGMAQEISKEQFKKKMFAFLNTNYNATKLSEGFYDCTYNIMKKSESIDYNMVFKAGYQCFPKHIGEIEFSDNGQKMFKFMGKSFVDGCTKMNQSSNSQVQAGKYCQCLYDTFVENNLGLKDILTPGFMRSEEGQKIMQQCYSANQ